MDYERTLKSDGWHFGRVWEGDCYHLFGYEDAKWAFYFYFIGWSFWSLGIHIYPPAPNIEIHLPFGYIRVGIRSSYKGEF